MPRVTSQEIPTVNSLRELAKRLSPKSLDQFMQKTSQDDNFVNTEQLEEVVRKKQVNSFKKRISKIKDSFAVLNSLGMSGLSDMLDEANSILLAKYTNLFREISQQIKYYKTFLKPYGENQEVYQQGSQLYYLASQVHASHFKRYGKAFRLYDKTDHKAASNEYLHMALKLNAKLTNLSHDEKETIANHYLDLIESASNKGQNQALFGYLSDYSKFVKGFNSHLSFVYFINFAIDSYLKLNHYAEADKLIKVANERKSSIPSDRIVGDVKYDLAMLYVSEALVGFNKLLSKQENKVSRTKLIQNTLKPGLQYLRDLVNGVELNDDIKSIEKLLLKWKAVFDSLHVVSFNTKQRAELNKEIPEIYTKVSSLLARVTELEIVSSRTPDFLSIFYPRIEKRASQESMSSSDEQDFHDQHDRKQLSRKLTPSKML